MGIYTTDEIAVVSDGEYRYYVGFTDAFSGHLKPERTEQSILCRNGGDNRFVDVSVLISDLSARKKNLHYVKIELVGCASNRSGLGATVIVSAGGQRYAKVHDGQSGYLSQSLYPLYFGLGAATAIDRIEVRWPSGKKQLLDGPITPNRLIQVSEP